MSLAKLAISRHVLSASFSIAIALLGILAYFNIGIDRHPDVELPALSITTGLPGMSAQNIASTLTQPLEARLNTVDGVDTLASSSVAGLSVITMTFHATADMAEMLNEVQARLSQARSELPADAQPSLVQRFSINASPVMWMTLSGSHSQLALTSLAKRLQKRIEPLSGVGEVRLRGAIQSALQVTVDDARLNAVGLTYADIENAFRQHHVNASGGRLKTVGKEYQLDLDFEYATPAQLAQLPVGEQGNRVIRLGELAAIEETAAPTRDLAHYNGYATVALGIVKASGSNPVDVIKRVRHNVDHELRPLLPADVALTVVTDEAKPIAQIVAVLKSHLIEGTLLTALVVWLFIQSARATTIIATAIPVSLLGAIAGLYWFGLTFNSFTLLALLLLIGVVVDDAIVVLENIYKTKEQHPELDGHTAAEKGTSEVMFAVMAATLMLVCVFGPVVFLPGVLGQYLQSFSLTVVIGVLVSWFVSLTLTPMLCARYLHVTPSASTIGARLQHAFRRLEHRYHAILRTSLQHPKRVLLGAAATLLPTALFMSELRTEFTPPANEGRIAVQLSLPSGLGKETIRALARQAESQLSDLSEVAGVLTTFEDGSQRGSDLLNLLVLLKEDRAYSQPEVMTTLQQRYAQIPHWRATVQPAAGSGSNKANGAPLHFYVLGPDHAALREVAHRMAQQLAAVPGMQHLRNDLHASQPQLKASLHAAEASRLGVTAQDVAHAVAALNGQLTLGRYTAKDGERYDVLLRSGQGIAPSTSAALEQIKVRTRSGELVPLTNVARFAPQGAPASLERVNQQYAVAFSGSPQLALGDAVAMVGQLGKKLPPGYTISFSGQAEEMRTARSNLAIVFGLGIVFLYLVLASQFNSFTQPFIIMLALPLALVGGMGALAATGQTLNVYSMIGLLLLMGLVAKNAILLIDRANQLVASGYTTNEALLLACPHRLRPIAMTSITVILALLPAAFGVGAGAENNQPLSIAVIGGMLSSTLLTLLVVPAAYCLLRRDTRAPRLPEFVVADPQDRTMANAWLAAETPGSEKGVTVSYCAVNS